MEAGKVYRVNAYAVSKACEYHTTNKDYAKNHGYLWVCVQAPDDIADDDDEVFYDCRSVATGKERAWTDDEMDEVGE